LTVYETQTVPANFTISRVHLILDTQPKQFNGLQLLQVTNPGDRAFYLPLPIPSDATDVQFQDVREQTLIKREEGGVILYPILPTTTDILYGLVLPYVPPDYRLQIPFGTNVGAMNLLVSETAGVAVSGSNLVKGETFRSEAGQQYLVYAGPRQPAGSTFTATISNLPGADNTGTLQTVIVLGGGVGALALLVYPLLQSRVLRAKAGEVGERVTQLQALARLDDSFEAGELEEEDYLAQRATLKAELLKEKTAP
jgi:hypothetical protein